MTTHSPRRITSSACGADAKKFLEPQPALSLRASSISADTSSKPNLPV